ncbi:MAG TPA: DUF2461 domain-containing protein [Leptospiraceae bacterium]|nr:DUF2461 domain-containing protein [Leptospiraceae bacterium]HMW05174.1 DUF2461 domain-containing protein [Leptospiraceae bacterium]HMX32519.1 DUF2461 domain-containing protein [Leptospiraceae bacterium]HMY32513.1 DUF2461 domain-containing protein [Leptospiraceae bacterium]HMZ63452.1 DUF2461 domain-containing protein [Leptospiraceae bacterium]
MIEKTTLDFLKNLKKNNSKEWFEKNRSHFEKAKQNFESFITQMIFEMAKINPDLVGVEPKKCIFRLNRDVRFSKNKEPYKNNFGAAISENGKSMETALFYFHLEPGNKSFIAAGRYMPDSKALRSIREKILEDSSAFKKIIESKKIKEIFTGLSDLKVKTVPRGYSKDHPEIELLKYTSFIVEKPVSDEFILSKEFTKLWIESYKAILPLLRYFNS